MGCLDEDELLAFAAERATAETRARVTAHVADCQGCAAMLAEAWRTLAGDAVLVTHDSHGAALQAEEWAGRRASGAESSDAGTHGRLLEDVFARSGDGGTSGSTSPRDDAGLFEAPKFRGEGLPAGTVIGRFVVLSFLGRGAMGEVYRVHDPQMDRAVALKLLRPSDSSRPGSAPLRLVQEARAMARVSHPNVIVAHEIGLHDDRVYLVMELVDGQSLDRWLGERRRGWREVLRIYLQAGAGLAAAHDAGVLHRDFKPHNVMVTRRDEARITDFGLARASMVPLEEAGAAAGSGVSSEVPSQDSSETSVVASSPLILTQAGTLLGTPAYMAPEQMRGQTIDARADQFSFCAALWEALTGERPYAGRTLEELAGSIKAGRVQRGRDGRDGRGVGRFPRSVRRLLLRGLAADPGHRWPNMAELLRALARILRWRERAPYLMGAAAVVLLGAFVMTQKRDAGIDFCATGARAIDEIWAGRRGGSSTADPARRKLAEALRSALPEAGDALATQVSAVLDQHADAWRSTYEVACAARVAARAEATSGARLGISRDEETLQCLEDDRRRLQGFLSVVSVADAVIAANVLSAAASLPLPAACVRVVDQATSSKELPTPREASWRAKLFRAKALVDLGKEEEALALMARLREDARKAGDAALLAELSAFGLDVTAFVNPIEAEAVALEALAAGSAADRPDLVAKAAELMIVVSGGRGAWAVADQWFVVAQASLRRVGPAKDFLESHLLNNYAQSFANRGKVLEAIELGRQSLAIKTRILPAFSRDLASDHCNLANFYVLVGDLPHAEAALAAAQRALSLASPSGLMRLNADVIAGDVENLAGRFGEAERLYEDVVARSAASAGSQPVGGDARRGLVLVALASGKPAKAAALAEEAETILRQHALFPNLAETFVAHVAALEQLGRRTEARTVAAKALDELGPLLPSYTAKLRAFLSAHPASSSSK